MIHSLGGKSYDTADGSEQPHANSAVGEKDQGRALLRWADDGAPQRVPTPPAAVGTGRKPRWSVLTLRQLRELLRLRLPGRTPQAPPPLPAAPIQLEDERSRAKEAHRAAHAAYMKEYYRNAWEHT